MRDTPQAANARRCKCADCKMILEKEQGVRYTYDMFHGRGQFYYCCTACDAKRTEREKENVAKQVALMDREARAQDVDYE